jgi:hypothetical protein
MYNCIFTKREIEKRVRSGGSGRREDESGFVVNDISS